ncbi:MAG TPA: PIN domain-containing protein [Terriglobia bacterium]
MTGKAFVDSNILIYAHDRDSGAKHHRAKQCLSDLWDTGTGYLSTQVLQEFYVNVTRMVRKPLSPGQARAIVRDFSLWVRSLLTASTVVRASEISETWQISFWDGLILAAAEQDGATELLSEDLSPGQVIAGVRIRNPFLP